VSQLMLAERASAGDRAHQLGASLAGKESKDAWSMSSRPSRIVASFVGLDAGALFVASTV